MGRGSRPEGCGLRWGAPPSEQEDTDGRSDGAGGGDVEQLAGNQQGAELQTAGVAVWVEGGSSDLGRAVQKGRGLRKLGGSWRRVLPLNGRILWSGRSIKVF